MIEHYVNEINRIPEATIRQRVHRSETEAAGWINGRLPVYYPTDLGIESALSAETERSAPAPR